MTDRQYFLGQIFKIWVDTIRGPNDVALLISRSKETADRFMQMCADLTGLVLHPAGYLTLDGETVAYTAVGIDELYPLYRALANNRIPTTLTVGIDPCLDFIHVGDVDDDAVDTDGLYWAPVNPTKRTRRP